MLPFAVSIGFLSLVQAAVVALPRTRARPGVLEPLARLRSRWWVLILPGSVAAVVFGLRAASGTAQGLTYLALIAVPPLAAIALAWLTGRHGRPLALAVLPLFALAWAARHALIGEAAAVALTALSCVTLAWLLAVVVPRRWLKLGIVLMALTDTALVVADLLQRPNDVLNAAHPAAGLPQLQRVAFGSAVMGYGDLLIAAALGALLAVRPRTQYRAAVLALLLAWAFDLLFFFVHELPATVPIAATLIIVELAQRRARRRAARGDQPASWAKVLAKA